MSDVRDINISAPVEGSSSGTIFLLRACASGVSPVSRRVVGKFCNLCCISCSINSSCITGSGAGC